MTPNEILEFWMQFEVHHGNGQRKGQAMMNALRDVAPELYFEISGSRYDIFYNDTSQGIYRFRKYLGI